jgi:hypothetical protein
LEEARKFSNNKWSKIETKNGHYHSSFTIPAVIKLFFNNFPFFSKLAAHNAIKIILIFNIINILPTLKLGGVVCLLSSAKLLDILFPTSTARISGYFYFYFQIFISIYIYQENAEIVKVVW